MKYFKTEYNNNKHTSYKDEKIQINYNLFKYNEENKKSKLNKLFLDRNEHKIKFIIKNNKNENNISINKETLIRRRNNSILNSHSQKGARINNKFNNLSLCLVPVLFHHKNNFNTCSTKGRNNYKPIYYNKTINDFLDRRIFNKKFSINKRRTVIEENDMKPKIRFTNIKKDLLEENQKINKMFITFQRQLIKKKRLLNL